jgi:hypothetical protein
LNIYIECPPASHLIKIISSRKYSINSLSVWNPNRYDWKPYKSYPGGIRYEDVKDLDLRSLEYLGLGNIGCKKIEMLMDLALQSTREEITLDLGEIDDIKPSVLRHDFMGRISVLDLSACELFGIISEQLTK